MTTDSELKHAIILPLTNYVAISNIVFTDFHGQDEGEDPDFDEQCRKQSVYEEKLYQTISDYTVQSNRLAALEARIDLTNSIIINWNNTSVSSLEKMLTELQQALDTLKKESE